ncbi:MAG: TIGR01906 family membrane protein [Chloroflexi bacterium]|nr:TIGR01906 family membrane protein [Chloroflexota bacterium]
METLKQILGWLVTILVPVVLVLAAVRLLLSPIFVTVEYRTPNFPTDSYGFSLEERLHWADISRAYLLNSAGIEFLGDQELEDGSPLYNQRELNHMLDVKIVVRAAMFVMYGALVFLVGIGILARRGNWWYTYRGAVSRGSWLTVGLIAAILVYLALNFNSLFVGFHRIFFEGETWIFKYSDTLIRLFPIRFWRDAFIWIGSLSLGGGLAVGYFFSHRRTGVGS